MVFPNCGPLPQISQTRAITLESFQACCRNLDFTGIRQISPKQTGQFAKLLTTKFTKEKPETNLLILRVLGGSGFCGLPREPQCPRLRIRAPLPPVETWLVLSQTRQAASLRGNQSPPATGGLLRRLAHHRLRTMAAPAGIDRNLAQAFRTLPGGRIR